VLGLGFALALGEILTRIFIPDPAFHKENQLEMWREDAFVGYRNKPNFHAYVRGFVPVQTNALGFRGPEVSIEKPPGNYRILGLGDSVTFGAAVRDEETFLRRLEQELPKRYGNNGVRFESINTGVVGYSTYQELVTLQRYGLPLCPDLVIVGFLSNDAYPTEDPFLNVHTFHVPVDEHSDRLDVHLPITYPLQVLTFLRATTKQIWISRGMKQAAKLEASSSWKPYGFGTTSWLVWMGHFLTLKSLAEQNGFRLLVLLFPAYAEVKYVDASVTPDNAAAKFLAEENVPYLDLAPPFRAAAPEEQFADWVHPNAAGHRTAAQATLRYLQETHWLDGVNPKTVRTCGH